MRLISVLFFCTLSLCCCKKFLDKNSSKGARPVTDLFQLQAVLDFYTVVNEGYPGMGEVASDDYYITTATWAASNPADQLNYIWDAGATSGFQWKQAYEIIYFANTVLKDLPLIQKTEQNKSEYENIKGQSLFYRGFSFYHIAQLWCKPYSVTANADPGIALRLVPDVDVPSVRSTVQETYDRILADLKEAAQLLPLNSAGVSRPSRAAAYAALARTYLSMRDYAHAGLYADSSLKVYNVLMDYNALNGSLAAPIARDNPESMLYGILQRVGLPYTTTAPIDSVLYQSYISNDLRKGVLFFLNGGLPCFKGAYGGPCFAAAGCTNDQPLYCGLATDEMYLTRAEASARAGLKDSAMGDLNTLLVKRWKTGTFIPYTATSTADALSKILQERRKELIFRGLRWMDLRRLNLEGANISLSRKINNQTYTLPPNDPRWVLLIPPDVISQTGMAQNPR